MARAGTVSESWALSQPNQSGHHEATVLVAALKQNGAQLDTEKFVATF